MSGIRRYYLSRLYKMRLRVRLSSFSSPCLRYESGCRPGSACLHPSASPNAQPSTSRCETSRPLSHEAIVDVGIFFSSWGVADHTATIKTWRERGGPRKERERETDRVAKVVKSRLRFRRREGSGRRLCGPLSSSFFSFFLFGGLSIFLFLAPGRLRGRGGAYIETRGVRTQLWNAAEQIQQQQRARDK